jgi:uncharacterized integral membrane protein
MAERRRSRFWRSALWVLGLVVVAAVMLFALENRGDLALNFWPTDYVLTLPVYAIVLAALILGFLLGGIVAWLVGGRRRAEQRQVERAAERLRRESEELRRRLDAAEATARQTPATIDRAKRQLVVANS